MSSESRAADDHGDPAACIGALEAELAALRTSRATLQAVVESVPDFIVRLSNDGVFEHLNRVPRSFRREQVQVIGEPCRSSRARRRSPQHRLLSLGRPA